MWRNERLNFFSGLCREKAMVAYTKPRRKKEERRKRKAKRRERDQITFIDLRFERWQVVRCRKARGRQDVP